MYFFQVVREQDFRDSDFHGSCRKGWNFWWSKGAREILRRSFRVTLMKNWFRLRCNGSFIRAATLNAQSLQGFHNSYIHTSRGSTFKVCQRKPFENILHEIPEVSMGISRITFRPLEILRFLFFRFIFKLCLRTFENVLNFIKQS